MVEMYYPRTVTIEDMLDIVMEVLDLDFRRPMALKAKIHCNLTKNERGRLKSKEFRLGITPASSVAKISTGLSGIMRQANFERFIDPPRNFTQTYFSEKFKMAIAYNDKAVLVWYLGRH